MRMIEPMIKEFEMESAATRKMLERVPEQHFGWQPHSKSMTLGRLASHIAEIPQWAPAITGMDEFVLDVGHKPYIAASTKELVDAFNSNYAQAIDAMKGESDEHLMGIWRMKAGGRTVFELPRGAVLRTMVLNHIVHHRGQLGVYLRLKDVPLPSVYGPSADDRQGM